MAQVLIRNLDDKVVRRLKKRAGEHKRSLQGEVKVILEEAANKMTMSEFRAATDRWQRQFKGKRFSDSAGLIREDRER